MRHAISFALLGTAPALLGCSSLDRATDVATGYVSHQLCSAAFVSRVEPEQFYREAIAPVLAPVDFLSGHQVDRGRTQVTASFAGVAQARAIDRGPLGCLVLHGEPPAPVALAPHTPAPALLPDIAGPSVVEPTLPALKQALDRTFAENASPPYRNTKAVVVVRDGRVIAERYAPGYGIDTQVMGWSATKSVTNALIGILVRQGRLSLEGPAPIAAWANPKDPRHAISIDNMLRMNSGLDIGNSLTARASTAFDPSAYMVFGVRDMAAFAEKAPLKAAPGASTSWNYTNGNTLLLSRIIRDNAGGDAASTLAFARRELFDKLGMHHVTLEFDAVGHAHRLQPHAGLGARLGALRPALPERRRGRRRAPAAAGLGRLLGGADAGQRALRLCRGLLDQPRRRRGPALSHRPRHPGRRLLRPRRERPVHHHRALAAPGRGALRRGLHRARRHGCRRPPGGRRDRGDRRRREA